MRAAWLARVGWLALLWSALAAATPPVGVRQAVLAAQSAADALARDGSFVEVDAARLRLEPDDGAQRNWVRVPAQPEAGVVELERVPLYAIDGWYGTTPGERPDFHDAFFEPPPGEALRSRYVVPLPANTPLLLSLHPATPSEVSLRWRSERSSLIAGRAASNLAAASFAAIIATALASLALTLAVREPAFHYFTAFAATFGLFLGVANGLAFELPAIGNALGSLGLRPLLLLGGLLATTGLLFANGLLGLSTRGIPLVRWVERLAWTLGALGIVLALLPTPMLRLALPWWASLITLAFVLPVGVAAWSWSLGVRIAGVLCVLWSGVLLVVLAQWAVSAGWLPPLDSLRWLQQLGGAVAVVALSVTLTDRVIALRREAERLHALHAESSASLQVEQQRRRFVESLRDASASAVATGDLEWKAFRLLLQTLDELLPGKAVALSITGYRGFDYLLAEPMNSKPRICALLAERGATLKGICRSRHAMQVALDIENSGEGGQYAVVPVNVPRPGWGALLIERDRGVVFDPSELAIAGDFVEAALHAIEEGAHKADLRRSAEVDPLTGLTNRRTGEQRLETLMRAAQHERQALSVLFIDFDLFRPLNERHGVAVGDQCLRAVADALRALLGPHDVLVRHGGDEFLLLLPEQDLEAARQLGERVRAQVASLRIRSDQGPLKVTVSVGVASLTANDLPQRLIARAERAAGIAKGNGRNQVAIAAAFGAQGDAPEKPPIF